jgi:small multidrug resistance family-3 protein
VVKANCLGVLHNGGMAMCRSRKFRAMWDLLRQVGLFAVTALAEIVGCYLPYLVVKQGRAIWLLIPAAASLALFAWLLTLHPSAAGRTYAAYGGVYIAVALAWLRVVDGVVLSRWDIGGACVALVGMAIIVMQPST